MSKRQFRLAPVAAAAMALAAGSAHAQWKVLPGVQLRELYSDNVALTADGPAEGQFVTELAPALTVQHSGPRLNLLGNFRLSAYAYSGERPQGTNRTRREASASADATLVDELLYVSGQGMTGQRAASPFGQPVTADGYSSANRDQVTSWSLSPYLQHRFGGGATMLLRYTRDHVSVAAQGVGTTTGDNVLFSAGSDPQRNVLSWNVQYNRQKLSSTQVEDTSSDELATTLRYRVGHELSLRIGAGYDKYDFSALGGVNEGRSWNTGFTWTPSARTSLDASYGHRFIGPVKSLQANHRSRNTVWSISYDDSVTTSRQNFLLPAALDTVTMLDRLFTARISDPLLRRQAVEDYIRQTGLPPTLADSINFFSNRYYLQKQLRASVALNSARTSSVLSLYRTRRDGLTSSQSDSTLLGSTSSNINDNTIQHGASVALNYRLGPRSSATLTHDASRSESVSGGFTSHSNVSRLTLTRTMARYLSASLEARRTSGSFGNGGAYRENALIAALTYQK